MSTESGSSSAIAPCSHEHIPIIDLSCFASDGSVKDRHATSRLLHHAFSHVGFAYIQGHGCPQKIMTDAFAALHQLFDLPPAQKMALDAKQSPLYRGYNSVATGAHSCTPQEDACFPDLKESFTIGAEAVGSSNSSPQSPMHGPNQWPADCPGFEKAIRAYWDVLLNVVAVRLMQAMALSLDMSDMNFFCQHCDDPVAQMLLLRYPPLTEQRRQGCGAHTDCGFLTILAQDTVAGLQVRHASGAWVMAPPIPGTFVVNLGDMAARWTNDVYKSTEHRVYNTSSTLCRHSIPFFINCNYDTMVSSIASCCAGEKENKYETPVKAGEYILEKLGLMHMAT